VRRQFCESKKKKMSGGFRLSAASCSAHAIDFHLRELNAMNKWNGEINGDSLVVGLVAAAQSEPTDETLSALTALSVVCFSRSISRHSN
jgi:hypothetical protein